MQCECYYEEIEFYYKNDYRKSQRIIGKCMGTKEREKCFCKGHKSECDFYDYIREQAKEDNLNNKILNAIKFLEENGYEIKKK